MQELVISVTRQHSPSTSRLPAPVLFAARSGRPPARRPFRLCATGCGHRVGVLEGEAEDKTLVVIRASNPLHATVISRKGAPTSPSAASTWWRACRCTILACRTPPRSAASSSLAGHDRVGREASKERSASPKVPAVTARPRERTLTHARAAAALPDDVLHRLCR